MRTFLLGFMGTGKSSVGKALATARGVPFFDTDALVAARAGKSIARIFAEDGETAFRALEGEALRDVIRHTDAVIATGGGILLNDNNRALIAKNGTAVLLRATLPALMQRLASETTHRPLLGERDWQERLSKLYHERERLYAQIPIQVQTDGKDVAAVVREITALLPSN